MSIYVVRLHFPRCRAKKSQINQNMGTVSCRAHCILNFHSKIPNTTELAPSDSHGSTQLFPPHVLIKCAFLTNTIPISQQKKN